GLLSLWGKTLLTKGFPQTPVPKLFCTAACAAVWLYYDLYKKSLKVGLVESLSSKRFPQKRKWVIK
ncbi:MAG: hypothetical protein J1F03_10515, partial [Oscillospiraceae bacterium]|nr:hypothetical protein [Oscillospiraceae bacterium]